MDNDALDFLLIILGLLLAVALYVIGEDSGYKDGISRGRAELCSPLLAYKPTLADSLQVARIWPECQWWGEGDMLLVGVDS